MEYLTLKEISKQYLSGKLSYRWWNRQAKTGKLKISKCGGKILATRDDVEIFVQALVQEQKQPEPEPAIQMMPQKTVFRHFPK